MKKQHEASPGPNRYINRASGARLSDYVQSVSQSSRVQPVARLPKDSESGESD